DGPSVVAIGGGHGLSAALEAVQLYAGKVTAVVSVADDGGSSGRLIQGMRIPAPGDIRRCLLALTPEPTLISALFAPRFSSGGVMAPSLGNRMLAALTDLFGDFETAVSAAGRMLGAVGEVIPATTAPVALRARIAGEIVEGQVSIGKSLAQIEMIELTPEDTSPNLRPLEAVAGADQIVIGPGAPFISLHRADRRPIGAGSGHGVHGFECPAGVRVQSDHPGRRDLGHGRRGPHPGPAEVGRNRRRGHRRGPRRTAAGPAGPLPDRLRRPDGRILGDTSRRRGRPDGGMARPRPVRPGPGTGASSGLISSEESGGDEGRYCGRRPADHRRRRSMPGER